MTTSEPISFELLLEFYEENKDKIMIPKDEQGTHTLNATNILSYIDSYNNIDMKKLNSFVDGEPATEQTKMLRHKYYKCLFKSNTLDLTGQPNYYKNQLQFIKRIALELILNIKYVTFDQFLLKIKFISIEILNLIKQYDKIHFIIWGKISKSSLWISLLYVKYFIANKTELEMNEFNKKILIFMRFICR
mgnify:CR=1 FL=1